MFDGFLGFDTSVSFAKIKHNSTPERKLHLAVFSAHIWQACDSCITS